jgi:lysosomal acid lipase/cholesteryl ester hydrolase
MDRKIALYTLEGVPDAEISTHYFSTDDKLGLSMFRFLRGPSDDVVLIIHGLTTSSDMFIMPEHYNLVRYLHDHGYPDVWCLDFRMSNRFPYNLYRHSFNMDEIALFDYPPALAKIRAVSGAKRIHVICHCLGAVSFTMSLFGGAVKGVTSVIANSAGLTPRIRSWSHFRLYVMPFIAEYILGFPYIDPNWRHERGLTPSKIFAMLVDLIHPECNVSACHMLSEIWGTGWPALYLHENLAAITHERGGDLYGATNVNYHRHVRKMIHAGRAVKYRPHDPRLKSLPDDYLANAKEIETPVLFMTGEQNNVFTDSNIHCFKLLDELVPGRHQLHVFKGYGHQDVFMGKSVDRDIFPRLVEFIDLHAQPTRHTANGSRSAAAEAAGATP